MPGIYYAGKRGFGVTDPSARPYLLANSLTGAGVPPAAAVYAGDLMVLTTKTTLTSNANVVTRMLLGADKTAHYLQGTPVAGILGMALYDVQSNSVGVATAPPSLSGIASGAAINYPLSGPGMFGQDKASNRSYQMVAVAGNGNIFAGRFDMNATDWTGPTVAVAHQFDNTLAGVIITVASGITTYTLEPAASGPGVATGAATADQCLRILGPVESDPLYNTPITVSGAAGAGPLGPMMYFEVLASFAQDLTGVNYSSN